MNFIEYTKEFGFLQNAQKTINNSGFAAKSTIQSKGKFDADGKLTSGVSKITDGNVIGKFQANKQLRSNGGKMTFGSKLGVAKAKWEGGKTGKQIGGIVGKTVAENQAIKAGLQPGTPEYNKFVQSKESTARAVGKFAGRMTGGFLKKNFGKNNYKF